MNSKITLAKVAFPVAEKNNRNVQDVEKVLKLLFQHISTALESGENVRVKGFGTFKLSSVSARKSVDVSSGLENEIPAHRRVVFVAARELAEAVNAPFEMFQTIVIDEDILEEELMMAETSGNEIEAESLRQQIILEEEKGDELEKIYPAEFVSETSVASNASEINEFPEPSETCDSSETSEDSVTSESNTSQSEEEQTDETEQNSQITEGSRNRGKYFWGLSIAAGVAVIVIGFLSLWFLNDDFSNWGRSLFGQKGQKETHANNIHENQFNEEEGLIDAEDNMAEANTDMTGIVADNPLQDIQKSEATVGSDNAEETVPTQPSDKEETEIKKEEKKNQKRVYDYVDETRYLSTIARECYGNFNLWPYIYKENEKILGHPNRIKPGTRVVVPDLAKYGVDPNNPKDIEKAKKMGVEIYSRYK